MNTCGSKINFLLFSLCGKSHTLLILILQVLNEDNTSLLQQLKIAQQDKHTESVQQSTPISDDRYIVCTLLVICAYSLYIEISKHFGAFY